MTGTEEDEKRRLYYYKKGQRLPREQHRWSCKIGPVNKIDHVLVEVKIILFFLIYLKNTFCLSSQPELNGFGEI